MMNNLNLFDLNTLSDDLWLAIIGNEPDRWRVYATLVFSVPNFARLVMKDPAKWRELLIIKSKKNTIVGPTTRWTLADRLHRESDLPAIVYSNGKQEWYKHGVCHRDGDLPARIYEDSTRMWLQNNELHRDNDQPAIIWSYGAQSWWQHGKRHRDGKPAVIYSYGVQEFWVNGAFLYMTLGVV